MVHSNVGLPVHRNRPLSSGQPISSQSISGDLASGQPTSGQLTSGDSASGTISSVRPSSPTAPNLHSPLSTRFMLAAHRYTDPQWLPLEQARIFQRTWLYVGDSRPLAPGQVWSLTLANQPVVITCVAPGIFKAFHNICPHRAALLCPKSGIHTPRHLVCPYHAWVYDLDGQLVGVPSQKLFSADVNLDAYSLKPLRVATWSHFLFISFSDDVPPLDTFLGSIPHTLGGHRRPGHSLLVQQSRQVSCNWKNYHDNTLCDYHVAIAHRHTLHRVQGPIKHYTHAFEAYTNVLATPVPPLWSRDNVTLPDLSQEAQSQLFTYGIFPNLHLLGFPNGLLAWIRILPLTVETCRVDLEIYGDRTVSPPIEILQQEFDEFMAEDRTLTESVQRGYASGHYVPGPVNALEARIVHQQQLILEFLQRD